MLFGEMGVIEHIKKRDCQSNDLRPVVAVTKENLKQKVDAADPFVRGIFIYRPYKRYE